MCAKLKCNYKFNVRKKNCNKFDLFLAIVWVGINLCHTHYNKILFLYQFPDDKFLLNFWLCFLSVNEYNMLNNQYSHMVLK